MYKYCNSNKVNKNGKQINKQRYVYMKYKRIFILENDTRYNIDKYNIEKRRLVVMMYINNVGIRSIERL